MMPRRPLASLRPLAVALALVVAGCSTAAPSSPAALGPSAAATTGEPLPSPTPAPTTEASPTATPAPPTIAMLIAEPLPSANAAAVLTIVPPPGLDTRALSGLLSVCTAGSPNESASERAVERETACLLAIAAVWNRVLANRDTVLAGTSVRAVQAARTIYAFAARSLGTTGRTFLDKALSDATWATRAAPSGLRTTKQLFAEPTTNVSTVQLFSAVRDAVAVDPSRSATNTPSPIHLLSGTDNGKAITGSLLAHCARVYPGTTWWSDSMVGRTVSMDQLQSCDFLASATWSLYLETGTAAAYRAAVDAYQYAYGQAFGCINLIGWSCRAKYVPQLQSDILRGG